MAAKRPALPPVAHLPQDLRTALEPTMDIISRVTSSVNPARKIVKLPTNGSATDADRTAKINEIIDRLQED